MRGFFVDRFSSSESGSPVRSTMVALVCMAIVGVVLGRDEIDLLEPSGCARGIALGSCKKEAIIGPLALLRPVKCAGLASGWGGWPAWKAGRAGACMTGADCAECAENEVLSGGSWEWRALEIWPG